MIKFTSVLFLFGSAVILISIGFIVLYEIPTTPDNLIEKQYDNFERLFINHYLFKDKEGIDETISYRVTHIEESGIPWYNGDGSFKSKYDSYTFNFIIHHNRLVLFSIDGYDDHCVPRASIQHVICANSRPLDDW